MIYTTGSTGIQLFSSCGWDSWTTQAEIHHISIPASTTEMILNKHWRIFTPRIASEVFRSVNLQIESIMCLEHFHSSQKFSMSIITQSSESSDLQDFHTEMGTVWPHSWLHLGTKREYPMLCSLAPAPNHLVPLL